MEQGWFITFEGPEGSGKSTQAKLLCQALTTHNIDYVFTREPGSTTIGETIRKLLLDTNSQIVPQAELFLYAAARAQNIQDNIQPALSNGQIVISDRFMDSSYAYQGFGRRLNPRHVELINAIAIQDLEPDLTFLVDISPSVGLARRKKFRTDRLEMENLEFHQRVREGYLHLYQRFRRFVLLDGEQDQMQLHQQVLAKTLQLMGMAKK